MKKVITGLLLAVFAFSGASAQIKLSKRYKGAVIVGNRAFQVGTLDIDFPDTVNVKITPQNSASNFNGSYTRFINPDTELPFTSQASLRLFILDNFFNNPQTTVDTAARYAINIETMGGEADNEYTLTYEPVAGTITATINGVQELVNYPGTGLDVELSPAYPVDNTDTIIFTYSYLP